MTETATAAAIRTVTWTPWRASEIENSWDDYVNTCIGTCGDRVFMLLDERIEGVNWPSLETIVASKWSQVWEGSPQSEAHSRHLLDEVTTDLFEFLRGNEIEI